MIKKEIFFLSLKDPCTEVGANPHSTRWQPRGFHAGRRQAVEEEEQDLWRSRHMQATGAAVQTGEPQCVRQPSP